MSQNNGDSNHIELSKKVENTHPKETQSENTLASYRILSFRSYAPDIYHSFVYANWMNSFKHGNDFAKKLDRDSYYKSYKKFIDYLLNKKDTVLKIAVLTEDEDIAFGFSVIEGDTLHYVFVPEVYRKNGIAKSLIPSDIKHITHLTNLGYKLWKEKILSAEYSPFIYEGNADG